MANLNTLPNELLDQILFESTSVYLIEKERSALLPLAHSCHAVYEAYKANEVALLESALSALAGSSSEQAVCIVQNDLSGCYLPDTTERVNALRIAVVHLHPRLARFAHYCQWHCQARPSPSTYSKSDHTPKQWTIAMYNYALYGIDIQGSGPLTELNSWDYTECSLAIRIDTETFLTGIFCEIVDELFQEYRLRVKTIGSGGLFAKVFSPGGWRFGYDFLGGNLPGLWETHYFNTVLHTPEGKTALNRARYGPSSIDLSKQQRLVKDWDCEY